MMVVVLHLLLYTHTLDCCIGGLVGRRHNEVRDAFGDLACLVWSQVHREPIVRESHDVADDATTLQSNVHQGAIKNSVSALSMSSMDIRSKISLAVMTCL